MRIMITGGGTGGHTSPALAIIEEIKKRDPRLELQWVGCKDSVEQRVCATHSIPFRTVPVKGWPRGNRFKQLWAGMHLLRGVLLAALHLKRYKPQAVIGVGGYVSVPLMWVAQQLGIPTILHEQNKQLGMANRLLAANAHRVLLSFPDTKGAEVSERCEVVGNPVRGGFSSPPSREEACRALALDPEIPVVLVCGGSQGSQSINHAIAQMLTNGLTTPLQLIWMTGTAGVLEARAVAEESSEVVNVYSFIDDMVTACAAAHLIVTRSGASTTAEVAQVGRASILIPYPHATDNHQEKNARAFEEAEASVVLLDSDCTAQALGECIETLIQNTPKLLRMEDAAKTLAQPVAVERIVEHVFEAAFSKTQ